MKELTLFLALIPAIIYGGKKEKTLTLISQKEKVKIPITKKAAQLSQTIQNLIKDCPVKTNAIIIPFHTNDIVTVKDILEQVASGKKNNQKTQNTITCIFNQKKHALMIGSLSIIDPAQTPTLYKMFISMLNNKIKSDSDSEELSEEYSILEKKLSSNILPQVISDINIDFVRENLREVMQIVPSKLSKNVIAYIFDKNQLKLMEEFLKIIDYLETPDFLYQAVAQVLVNNVFCQTPQLKHFIKTHETSYDYDIIKYFKRLLIKKIVNSKDITIGSYIEKIQHWRPFYYNNLIKDSGIDLSDKNLYSLTGINKLASKKVYTLSLAKNSIIDTTYDVDANYKPLGKLFPQLVSIDLSHNKIEILTEKMLGQFNNLKKLTINNNQIEKIEDGVLKSLNNLNELNLSYNNIEDIRSLHYLTNLTNLNLKNNKIKRIPDKLCEKLTKLEKLDLSDNKIKSISSNLKNLINVRTFNICYSGNVKQKKKLKQKIIHLITHAESLKKLHINYASQELSALCNKKGINLVKLSDPSSNSNSSSD